MTIYIGFLVFVFVMGGLAPKLMRRPWVLALICLALCVSFYSTRLFG